MASWKLTNVLNPTLQNGKPDRLSRAMVHGMIVFWLCFAALQIVGLLHSAVGEPFAMPGNCNQWDDWIHWCQPAPRDHTGTENVVR